jgi:hypothetical protein
MQVNERLEFPGLEDVEGLDEPFAPGAAAEVAQDVPDLDRGVGAPGALPECEIG